MLIGADGFPVLEPATNQKILGNAYPKWVAGIANTLSYKSFSLYFLFDGHFDVEKYDQLNNFMAAFGIKSIRKTGIRQRFSMVFWQMEQRTPNRFGWARAWVLTVLTTATVITGMFIAG